ncbi:MAG: hypothetical protein ACKPCI_26540, partial [Dolichospermum sp.]
MLTTIAKRIQSRLSRSGVRIALGDIKEYLKINSDVENITDSDVNLATDYFMSNAAALTVTENVDNTINTLSIQDMDNNFNDGDSGVAPLTTTTKSELVASTAQNMGITLDTSEISLIAENISNSSDDFDQDIDAIKAAIMAFIDHKSMINQSKINELIYEVRDLVGNKN